MIYKIIWWNEKSVFCNYDEIYRIKLKNNKFSLGFTIMRKVEDYFILYSFATRRKDREIKDWYKKNIQKLIGLGDFCYKSVRAL